MIRTLFAILSIAALTASAVTNTNTVVSVRMATEPYVTNRIGAALAPFTSNLASVASVAATALQPSNLVGLASEASLSSIRVQRCYDPDNTNRWGELGPTNTIVIREISSPTWRIEGSGAPLPLSYPLANFNDAVYEVQIEASIARVWWYFGEIGAYGEAAPTDTVIHLFSDPENNPTNFIYSSVTNTFVYPIYTNRVPDWIWDMGSIDVLQGWLNGIYYTRLQSDARYVLLADKDYHVDGYTNVIWRDVRSNGWHWTVAYTNTP